MTLIFITSILPEVPGGATIPYFQEIGHFVQFFVLAVLFLAYVSEKWKESVSPVLFFAIFIEVFQYFLGWRAFEVLDLVIDALGISTGLIAYKIVLNNVR
jgi:VanZ family protein